jgi:hypothetical protein
MNTKSNVSGRDSVEVPDSAKSVAERQSTEARVNAIVAKFALAHLQRVSDVRQRLRKRLPTAYEIVYEYRSWFVISFSPSDKGYEGVLSIRGDAGGVKLYFNRGKELPDPEKLLKGTSQTRYIDVEDASRLDTQAVTRLVDEAIASNPMPFPSAGTGSVIIRPATPK